MKVDDLKIIIESHILWLQGNQSGRRADLSGADLRRADLSGADLKHADLSGADLKHADLRRADLSGADLRHADLSGADLRHADLSGADLRHADLRRADLSGADLRHADLSGADLRHADLRRAIGVDLVLAQTEIQPREGEVFGWKKCRDGVLVKVRVPPSARRSNATGRKCRAEYVEVHEVVGSEVGVSCHDGKTEYRIGKNVVADGWTEDRLIECGQGIHYFLTREEAEAYA